jgi:hypothetical protein
LNEIIDTSSDKKEKTESQLLLLYHVDHAGTTEYSVILPQYQTRVARPEEQVTVQYERLIKFSTVEHLIVEREDILSRKERSSTPLVANIASPECIGRNSREM